MIELRCMEINVIIIFKPKMLCEIQHVYKTNSDEETSCEIQWEKLAQECMILNYDAWKLNRKASV